MEEQTPPPPPPPPPFPMAPRAYPGSSNEVEAGACFEWLRHGWAMFLGNPGMWVGAGAIVFVTLFFLFFTIIGQLAASMLLPILGAGMIYLCRCQVQGEPQKIGDLFIAFRVRTSSLLVVSALYTAGIFGIAILGFLLVTGGLLGGAVTGRVAGIVVAVGGVMVATLLVLALSVPVIMATWFAPPLVLFHNMPPVAAMKASFEACYRNWLPFTVYGIVLFILCFFAFLPAMLGFILLIPVLAGAWYASYRDIFPGV